MANVGASDTVLHVKLPNARVPKVGDAWLHALTMERMASMCDEEDGIHRYVRGSTMQGGSEKGPVHTHYRS